MICLLLSSCCICRIFLLTDKKGRTKKYIYALKKLFFLVYNINYYLLVLIECHKVFVRNVTVTNDVTSSLPSKRMRTNEQSRLAASKAVFEAVLIILSDAASNFMTGTTSFEPPSVSKTLPTGQCDGGISFIIAITRSPSFKLRDFVFHFRRIVKMGKYPHTHLLWNISVTA